MSSVEAVANGALKWNDFFFSRVQQLFFNYWCFLLWVSLLTSNLDQ